MWASRGADVELAGGTIRLRAEESKNGQGRLVALEGELRAILERRLGERAVLTAEGGSALSTYVFHRGDGQRIRSLWGAWSRACKAAGLPGLLFHDLRRSAVRNMVRAGVPETVAMKISGHRTRAIFDRYNITSERDVREAVMKTQAFLSAQPEARSVIPLRDAAKSG